MYIEKIHIDTFGKLSDCEVELTPGVNIIEGANESGKSTLAAFIKFILYGIPTREREGTLSWHTGGAAGSLTVNDGKQRYRIERALVGSREVVQLIDGETNMPIRHVLDGKTPGELFFGVDADMFAATAFVSQLGGAALGGAKVSEGIENILFSADESVNTQRALTKLDSMRASLLHKNEKGGRLWELDEECAAAEVRLSEAMRTHDEILAKQAQLADIREKHTAAETKASSISARVEQFEARTLLELFARGRRLETKLADLRGRIEQVADTDVEAVGKLEEAIKRIGMLSNEASEASEREANTPMVGSDTELDEYIARGGRTALEAEQSLCRIRAKTYTAVGVVSLLIGLVIIAIGVLPLMMSGSAQLGLVIGGAVLAALSVTLFILGSRARSRADDIDIEYDFDELDRRIADRAAATEAAKLASLASMTARRRLEDACADVKRVYGCEVRELDAILAEQKEKLRAVEGLKAEYDKYATVLSQIKAQLRPYNESELRDSLDDTVDISDIDAANLPAMRREAEFAKKMAASLEKHTVELEKTLAGLYPIAEEPTRAADKLSALKAERELLTKRHAAYKLALQKLTEASDRLRESIAPRLAADTAQLMAHLTGGKYKTLGVGTALELCAETENGTKPLEYLSAGTQDAAYLCLRIALVSLLYRKELPPMLYDEAFSRQDDTRLTAMLKLLYLQEAQSLVFTSNSRESTLMKNVGGFKLIQM